MQAQTNISSRFDRGPGQSNLTSISEQTQRPPHTVDLSQISSPLDPGRTPDIERTPSPFDALPKQTGSHGSELPKGSISYMRDARTERGSYDSLEDVARIMDQRAEALHSRSSLPIQDLQSHVSFFHL